MRSTSVVDSRVCPLFPPRYYLLLTEQVCEEGPSHEYISHPGLNVGQGSSPYFNKVVLQYLLGLCWTPLIDIHYNRRSFCYSSSKCFCIVRRVRVVRFVATWLSCIDASMMRCFSELRQTDWYRYFIYLVLLFSYKQWAALIAMYWVMGFFLTNGHWVKG